MSFYSNYKDIVYQIVGAAMEVHTSLGKGLLEPIYNEALAMELEERGIECEREKEVQCFYKGKKLNKKYRMDLVVGGICVELKSANKLSSGHRAQLFNYLRLTDMKMGLLINFGQDSLQGERYGYHEESGGFQLLDKNMDYVFETVSWDYESEDDNNYL